MIEFVARTIHQHNAYVVNSLGREELMHKLSVAQTEHCENPKNVAERWIERASLMPGDFDIMDVDGEMCCNPPRATLMGKVYARLIASTLDEEMEDYADGIVRVYNSWICEHIDNYNGSTYYEPSYFLTRSYFVGNFN